VGYYYFALATETAPRFRPPKALALLPHLGDPTVAARSDAIAFATVANTATLAAGSPARPESVDGFLGAVFAADMTGLAGD
jgi:hypothetical protein